MASKVAPVLPVRAFVAQRAAGSCRRLGVAQLDLYQLHQPNPVVPLTEQMAAMKALQRSGVIRLIGVSNYSLDRWQAAEGALGGPVWSNQVQFNLVHRRPLEGMTKWAQANDRVVIAYSPLAQGLLSGRYDAEHRPTAMRASSPAFLPENLDRARFLLQTLRDIATSHDATLGADRPCLGDQPSERRRDPGRQHRRPVAAQRRSGRHRAHRGGHAPPDGCR